MRSSEKREFNLLLIGLDGSGKSSLLERVKLSHSRGLPPSQHQLGLILRKVSISVPRHARNADNVVRDGIFSYVHTTHA